MKVGARTVAPEGSPEEMFTEMFTDGRLLEAWLEWREPRREVEAPGVYTTRKQWEELCHLVKAGVPEELSQWRGAARLVLKLRGSREETPQLPSLPL